MYEFNNGGIIKIAIADDHALFREVLCREINSWDNFKVILQGDNGKELIENINQRNLPTIAIVDINMQPMNGYATAEWLHTNHPEIRIIGLSFYNSEETAWPLVQSGASGFVNKCSYVNELKKTALMY
ncbi:MAG: hypothetical protein C4308_03575 [Chitinophagaceae bacterium]